MKGYNSYNFYRKFRHRRARRNSGGVAAYFKHELKHGIEIVKNVYDTIIWIKLEKTFFDLQEDIFICGSYIWGEDSPAYNVHNVDLFELLEDYINYYKLTRNKNARHIFPHHFFPVAMIGIICIHMHFVLYTLNTRSIFFKYLHYFR